MRISLSVAFHREERRAGRIRNTQLKIPAIGPVLGLLILANFDEDFIPALFQLGAHGVLVDLLVAMIFVLTEKKFSVQPYLEGILRSQAELDEPGLLGIELGVGI